MHAPQEVAKWSPAVPRQVERSPQGALTPAEFASNASTANHGSHRAKPQIDQEGPSQRSHARDCSQLRCANLLDEAVNGIAAGRAKASATSASVPLPQGVAIGHRSAFAQEPQPPVENIHRSGCDQVQHPDDAAVLRRPWRWLAKQQAADSSCRNPAQNSLRSYKNRRHQGQHHRQTPKPARAEWLVPQLCSIGAAHEAASCRRLQPGECGHGS